MDAATCRALVESFYGDVWNRRDRVRAAEILAPDLRFRGSLDQEKAGVAGFLDYADSVHAALADYTCTIEALVADGGRAAARVRFEGRHEGPFLGHTPTGRPVIWMGAAFFTFADSRIAEIWVLGDLDGLKRQLKEAV